MLQPFERFKLIHLAKLQDLKHRYLVSQSYQRAFDHLEEADKVDVLLTDYKDHGLAKTHFNAVKHDKYGAVLDLENEKHLSKLKEMMGQHSTYRLFWAVVKSAKDLEHTINKVYKEQMRAYINVKTNWQPKGGSMLYPTIQLTFGELFIILKHGSQTLRIKFEEIEAM